MKQLSCWSHAPLSISLHDSWRLPHSYYEQKVQKKSTYTASAAITASTMATGGVDLSILNEVSL